MKNKIKYRSPLVASYKVAKIASKHIPRLGKLYSIKGIRFTSTRESVTTDREAVLVKGEFGSVRLFGICWSYFGNGPHTLIQVLMTAGLSRDLSERIAFRSPRNDFDGIDWEYNFLSETLKENYVQITSREQMYSPDYKGKAIAI